MGEAERTRLIENIGGHLKPVRIEIKERAVREMYKVDPEYGMRVA
jgi:catalase